MPSGLTEAQGREQAPGRRGPVDDPRAGQGHSGAKQVSWSQVGSVEASELNLGSNPAFDSYKPCQSK